MEGTSCLQNYLEISRSDLRRNAAALAAFVGCPVIGVVKCDGYGVSVPEAAAAWRDAGVTVFAVSEPAEALALRACGFADADILLLAPVADADILREMHRSGVILTVTGPACAAFYAKTVDAPRVHVAVDTGMGRFGTRWDAAETLREIYRTPGLRFEGIFSHFAASFEKTYNRTGTQLARFLQAVHTLEASGIRVGMRHIANSCAALRFPQTRLDAVRIGSALTGRLSAPVPIDLQPIGVFRAMVVDRRTLHRGDRTGYASLCRVRRDTEVAIVSAGQRDGFGLEKRVDSFRPQELLRGLYRTLRAYRSGPLYMEWHGARLPVVGRIGTQYTLLCADGTDIRPGDSVSAAPPAALYWPALHRIYT